MGKKILFLIQMCQFCLAAGWSIVGDTFTEKRGSCEFDIWLQNSKPSHYLGFYADCVVGKMTSLQIASNTSTQSLENQAFVELEQSFFTTKNQNFNIGVIVGNGIGGVDRKIDNNFYGYFPISFNWLDHSLRTTLSAGIASNHNFREHFFTLGASISGNLTKKIWIVGEVSITGNQRIVLNASFYQVGLSFLVHADNIAVDIAYSNSFSHGEIGSLKLGIAFYTSLF